MTDTFSARTPLTVGTRKYDIWSLGIAAGRQGGQAAVLAEDPAREPAALRGRRQRHAPDIEALLDWDPKADARPRDLVHAGARDHAGLHRRALRRRPRRHARGDPEAGRRPGARQSAGAGRTGHRPLGAGRRLRHRRRAGATTPGSSSSATASATRSCAGARRRSRTSRSCRRTPASCTRSTSSTSAASCSRRSGGTRRPIPTRRRHRLAHHDDQRPRRARLGRRRHRGRGRHARPAGHDADPAGHRVQLTGQLPPGARPPTWC